MHEPQQLLLEVADVVGAEMVEPGSPSNAVGDVIPGVVVTPPDIDAVCRLLAWADRRRVAVTPLGGGTKVGWGGVPPVVDVALSTRRLDAVIEHRHADLTATVQAGVTLDAVNRDLATHGQWIALDPCGSDRATIGGILATNDSGPSRHHHGAPRDLLLGVTFVTGDGTLAHAGGRVVKNVAGYDIGKLLVGSHGSLGVIVEATFKLLPRPEASRTVEVTTSSPHALTRCALQVASSQLVATAIEVVWPPPRALVRFESVERAVIEQAHAACEIARSHEAAARVLDADEEASCWREHASLPWAGDAAVVALGIAGSHVGRELEWLGDAATQSGLQVTVVGRLALGSLRVALRGPLDAQVSTVELLRARRRDTGGHVVLLRGSGELRRRVDPWGPLGDVARIMPAIKRRFDPNGVLNAGRWPFEREPQA